MKNILCLRKALFLTLSLHGASTAMAMEQEGKGPLQLYTQKSRIKEGPMEESWLSDGMRNDYKRAADAIVGAAWQFPGVIKTAGLKTVEVFYENSLKIIGMETRSQQAQRKFEEGFATFEKLKKELTEEKNPSREMNENERKRLENCIELIEEAAEENNLYANKFMFNFYRQQLSKIQDGLTSPNEEAEKTLRQNIQYYGVKGADLGDPGCLLFVGNHYEKQGMWLMTTALARNSDRGPAIETCSKAKEFYEKSREKYQEMLLKKTNQEEINAIKTNLYNIEINLVTVDTVVAKLKERKRNR